MQQSPISMMQEPSTSQQRAEYPRHQGGPFICAVRDSGLRAHPTDKKTCNSPVSPALRALPPISPRPITRSIPQSLITGPSSWAARCPPLGTYQYHLPSSASSASGKGCLRFAPPTMPGVAGDARSPADPHPHGLLLPEYTSQICTAWPDCSCSRRVSDCAIHGAPRISPEGHDSPRLSQESISPEAETDGFPMSRPIPFVCASLRRIRADDREPRARS